MAVEELQQAMPPAQGIAPDILPAAQQIAHRFLRLVRNMDRGHLARAKQADELGRVAPIGLDALTGSPGR
jgi:hypothetical protein